MAAFLFGAPTVAAQTGGTVGATAIVRDANGAEVGSAIFSQAAGGVHVTLNGRSLPPGRHGIHLQTVGQCEPPAFTSAGGHFNPTNRQHGLSNPQGPHLGDLPELVVAANGTAAYAATNSLVTLGTGVNSLFDADGTAIVIHADPDDQVTDPTGNSGARIACGVGVLVRGTAALPATGDAGGPRRRTRRWSPAAPWPRSACFSSVSGAPRRRPGGGQPARRRASL